VTVAGSAHREERRVIGLVRSTEAFGGVFHRQVGGPPAPGRRYRRHLALTVTTLGLMRDHRQLNGMEVNDLSLRREVACQAVEG